VSFAEAVSPVAEACQANFTRDGVPLVTMPVKLSCPATNVAGLATETAAGPLGGGVGSVMVTGVLFVVTVGAVVLSTTRTMSPDLARCTATEAMPLMSATAWYAVSTAPLGIGIPGADTAGDAQVLDEGLVGFAGDWLAAIVRTRAGRRLDSPALVADGAQLRPGVLGRGRLLGSSAGFGLRGVEFAPRLVPVHFLAEQGPFGQDRYAIVGHGQEPAADRGSHRVGVVAEDLDQAALGLRDDLLGDDQTITVGEGRAARTLMNGVSLEVQAST